MGQSGLTMVGWGKWDGWEERRDRVGVLGGTGVWGRKAALCKMPPCSLQTSGPGEGDVCTGTCPQGWGLARRAIHPGLQGCSPGKKGVSASHPLLPGSRPCSPRGQPCSPPCHQLLSPLLQH